MQQLSIAVIGTTKRTTLCAEALLTSGSFVIPWILTPEPREIGRKKVLTKNPLHAFAESKDIPAITFNNKVSEVKDTLRTQTEVDFILVVDFGYIVPQWLLDIPTIAPLNIHPSDLPKWRGSSPAQFCLLYGESSTAVTLMKMNAKLDQGPIIASLPFTVQPNWDAEKYYAHSFKLISAKLPELVYDYAKNQVHTSQPEKSPTPIARRIQKSDACIPWEYLASAQAEGDFTPSQSEALSLPELLQDALAQHPTFSDLVVAATKAFSPWPKLWTLVPTAKGEKRMQIHSASVQNGRLALETVQIEGQSPAQFNQVGNIIQ